MRNIMPDSNLKSINSYYDAYLSCKAVFFCWIQMPQVIRPDLAIWITTNEAEDLFEKVVMEFFGRKPVLC